MKWYNVSADHFIFWEVRMKVREIIENMKISFQSGADVMEIYNAIVKYSQDTQKAPRTYTWALTDDNVLTVNGASLKRVGPKKGWGFRCDEAKADYWENRILARQEAWMD